MSIRVDRSQVPYIEPGGQVGRLRSTGDLGITASPRIAMRTYGPRQAVWDIAFGYVSGFPAGAIAYFVLTRSLSERLSRWAIRREGARRG